MSTRHLKYCACQMETDDNFTKRHPSLSKRGPSSPHSALATKKYFRNHLSFRPRRANVSATCRKHHTLLLSPTTTVQTSKCPVSLTPATRKVHSLKNRARRASKTTPLEQSRASQAFCASLRNFHASRCRQKKQLTKSISNEPRLQTHHVNSTSILHPLHFTVQTLHSTLYTLHSTLYTPHFTLHTLYSTLYTLSTPHTLHSTLDILHSTLRTLQFTLYTLHPTLYTPHSTLYTPRSTLYTLHFTLHTLHFALHTLHCTLHTLHPTLYTPHSTLPTLHFSLHTLHFTLQTPHFKLHTPHSTLCTPHSTLCTPPSSIFHSIRCTGMVTGEKWTRLFK